MKLVSFQSEEEASVLMAPLIDCVFILLIFFLVTSMLSKPHNELALQVPHSGAGKVDSGDKEPVIITVTSTNPDPMAPKAVAGTQWDPFVLIGDEFMTRDLMDRRLRQIAQETPNRRIRIDSEPQLKWRHLVPIIDVCRFHGLTRVDVRTN